MTTSTLEHPEVKVQYVIQLVRRDTQCSLGYYRSDDTELTMDLAEACRYSTYTHAQRDVDLNHQHWDLEGNTFFVAVPV